MRFHIELGADLVIEDVYEVGPFEAEANVIRRINAALRSVGVEVRSIKGTNIYRTDGIADAGSAATTNSGLEEGD